MKNPVQEKEVRIYRAVMSSNEKIFSLNELLNEERAKGWDGEAPFSSQHCNQRD